MENGAFYKKYSRIAAVVLSAVVAVHFVFTIMYVIPDHYFPNQVNRVVGAYMLPVFHQGWNLFAPDPPLKEKSMLFRVKTNAGWTAWQNPGEALLEAHDKCRLSNANIEFRLHQNAAYRLWEEQYRAEEMSIQKGNTFNTTQYLLESRGYRSAKYYASRFFRSQSNVGFADSIQLRLIIEAPPEFPNREGKWSRTEINFPADAID